MELREKMRGRKKTGRGEDGGKEREEGREGFRRGCTCLLQSIKSPKLKQL